MKKLSIFLCVLMLAACIITPMSTYAAEDDSISGTWVFNDSISAPSSTFSVNVNFTTYCYFNNNSITEFKSIAWSKFDSLKVSSYDGSVANLSLYENNKVVNQWNKVVTFNSEPTGTDAELLKTWLKANATKTHNADGSPIVHECDGSSCPATDPNEDNICDDCGLPFTYNLRNYTYEYSSVYLPVHPDVDSEEYPYWHMTYNEVTQGGTFVASSVPIKYNAEKNSLVYSAAGKTVMYDAVVGDTEWTLRGSYNVQEGQNAAQPYTLAIWSTYHVKSDDGVTVLLGDPNFLPPLWEMTEQVTQGVIPTLVQSLGGTTLTLLLCGVGLMACLVVLSLFGKRSLIYRN